MKSPKGNYVKKTSFNSEPNHRILDWFKFKALICRRRNKHQSLVRVEKDMQDGKKCWLPPFSSLPTMFSKGFFPKIIKGWTVLTHSHTMTPFDAPGKQAF